MRFLVMMAALFLVGASEASEMPKGFCKELQGLYKHSLSYRDTKEACEWDWKHKRPAKK